MDTDVYFGDSTQLTYLRARYYSSGTGRFLTRDTWGGDYNRPLSLNRWNYVEGNPINFTDPSGNVPCHMLPPEDQVNCIATPPPPDWWVNKKQLYVDGLGYFDVKHLDRGWRHAKFFIEEIKKILEENLIPRRHYGYGGMIPLSRARSNDYWVDYVVSDKITDSQINGVAYGMLIDFELGYEQYQTTHFPWLSGFGPADLPSDHLGFWAYINGYEKNEIPTLLKCLGNVHVLGGDLSSIVSDSDQLFVTNHEFLPMVMETSRAGRGITIYTAKNTTWPAFLEIQPIPSGPNTWKTWKRSH